MEIKSVVDFLKWIQLEAVSAQMYRGQCDISWLLLPSLCRYSENEDIKIGFDSILSLEEQLIDDFVKYSIPHIDMREMPYIEKLVYGQHYGLPTRLLDWSTNPLKALFFAIENHNLDDLDGVVFAVEPDCWAESTKDLTINKMLEFLFPELLNDRVTAQEGCFTSFPVNSDSGFEVKPLTEKNYSEEILNLFSVIIPAEHKQMLRLELSVLGISHRTLFPGLDGIARWVKSNIAIHSV